MKQALSIAACVCFAAVASSVCGGHFKTVTIDGNYSDWDDVPVVDDDSGDNSGGPDIGVTKIANDADFLYIYNTFPNGIELSTYTALDVDSNASSGFDVFGLGLIGSEASWQNDFPFTQDAANFNNGLGMSGDYFGSGAALLDDFANGTERELAISLDILFNSDNSPVFADGAFDLLFWTNTGLGADGIPAGFPGDSGLNGDVSAAISYTLAVPEPIGATLAMLSLGLALVSRNR